MKISTGSTIKFNKNGQVIEGRVLGIDSDPKAAIWVCGTVNPDAEYWVMISDVVEVNNA